MHDWPLRLAQRVEHGTPAVLVTVTDVRGSAPREIGCRMLITPTESLGTIGGGQLEHRCQRIARDALSGTLPLRVLQRFVLGSDCGQCCGGVAEIAFERIDTVEPWLEAAVATIRAGSRAALLTRLAPDKDGVLHWRHQLVSRDRIAKHAAVGQNQRVLGDIDGAQLRALRAAVAPQPRSSSGQPQGRRSPSQARWLVAPIGPAELTVVLFGAGHVGRACAQVLATVEASVFVVDSRPECLQGDWPDGVTPAYIAQPADFVAHCPANAVYLVMTHDHGLDLALCEAILARDDRRFCGLIGSRSKWRRFEKRLRALGYDEPTLATLTCPIGIEAIRGKRPGDIAVAVAAQLLTLDADEATTPLSRGDVVTLHPDDRHPIA